MPYPFYSTVDRLLLQCWDNSADSELGHSLTHRKALEETRIVKGLKCVFGEQLKELKVNEWRRVGKEGHADT